MSFHSIAAQLSARISALAAHLGGDNAPLIAEQRHLDTATPESLYWHHGYQTALTDVLRLAALEIPGGHSKDRLASSPSAARDARSYH